VPPLLDELRQRRTTAREAADAILTRAQEETRDLTADELAQYQARIVEQREADDAIEAERDRELAELRAAQTRRPGRPP
jgi:F0F1-type ATP synthase membrane subunit b/b'